MVEGSVGGRIEDLPDDTSQTDRMDISRKARQFTVGAIETAFRFYSPTSRLSRFVDCLWICEGSGSLQKPDRILPTGTLELAINMKQDHLRFRDAGHLGPSSSYSAAVVSGASTRGFAPDPDNEVFIIGAHFKPGGAYPVLGFPVSEIADSHVDLSAVLGAPAETLRERLCEARSDSERFCLLEEALARRIDDSSGNHYAVAAALEMIAKSPSSPRVRNTAAELGLSQRRFIEVFKTEVGMTPKIYSRIHRFQRARNAMRQGSTDWSQFALEYGYCDQSHLIREFVEFSGSTPTGYIDRYEHRSDIQPELT